MSWTRSSLSTHPTTLTLEAALGDLARWHRVVDLVGILRFSALVRVFVEMEVLCRSQSGGAAFFSIVELFVAEVALAAEKALLSFLLAMGSSASQTAPLVEGPDAIYRILRKSKDEAVPENKDDGDSDEDEEDDEDDNEEDGEDQEDDGGAQGDPSGDENAEGDENDNLEANGEGGGDDDDEGEDDDSDDDEEEVEEEEDEEEDDEDELPQPPAKKRK